MIVNLWPSRDESEAAATDPRRLGELERHGLDPTRFSREHHELEAYEVLAEGG